MNLPSSSTSNPTCSGKPSWLYPWDLSLIHYRNYPSYNYFNMFFKICLWYFTLSCVLSHQLDCEALQGIDCIFLLQIDKCTKGWSRLRVGEWPLVETQPMSATDRNRHTWDKGRGKQKEQRLGVRERGSNAESAFQNQSQVIRLVSASHSLVYWPWLLVRTATVELKKGRISKCEAYLIWEAAWLQKLKFWSRQRIPQFSRVMTVQRKKSPYHWRKFHSREGGRDAVSGNVDSEWK